MTQRIVYKNDDGTISIVIPTLEAIRAIGIDKIAEKDVPTGKPYAILDASQIPSDRTFRTAWTIDDKLLKDGIGA